VSVIGIASWFSGGVQLVQTFWPVAIVLDIRRSWLVRMMRSDGGALIVSK